MPPRQCSRSRSWRVQQSCVPSRMATVSPSPALPFSISAVLYSMRPAAACTDSRCQRKWMYDWRALVLWQCQSMLTCEQA